MTYYSAFYFKERKNIIWPIIWVLERFLIDNKINKILEVGAGTGWLTRYFKNKGFDIVGTDNSEIVCQKYHLKKAEATALPFPSAAFDLVIGVSLIEHLTLKEGGEFLKEVARVLKEKGWIFLVTPNLWAPRRFFLKKRWVGFLDPTHHHLYHYFGIKKLLKEKGFTKISYFHPIDYHPEIIWPLPSFIKKSPPFLKGFLNFLLISTPLALLRDSLMIKARKK